jgi:hypothetical protein
MASQPFRARRIALPLLLGLALQGPVLAASTATPNAEKQGGEGPAAANPADMDDRSLFEDELSGQFPASYLMYMRLSSSEQRQVFEAYRRSDSLEEAKDLIPGLFRQGDLAQQAR